MDDLNCLICYNLLCQPTTMHCGHSFCRDCAVKLFNTDRKINCPICRTTLSKELPRVNVTLKTLIEFIKVKDCDGLINKEEKSVFQGCKRVYISRKFINEHKISLNELITSKNESFKQERKGETRIMEGIFVTLIAIFLLLLCKLF